MEKIKLTLPTTAEITAKLRVGDSVLVSGVLYTARDAAHKLLVHAVECGEELPVPLSGQGIYYVGPTPAKPGNVSGPAGPTTAGRMDKYTPTLLEKGLLVMLGKGARSTEVVESIKEHKAVYLGVTGGVAALISKHIKESEVVAYPHLGAEAIHRYYVDDLPAVVLIDSEGGNLYESERELYKASPYTTLHFVRHAQSDNTVKDDRSRPLTAKGLASRQEVADMLKDKNITHIYSSPYKRTMDTLSVFAEEQQLEIKTFDALREREIGTWVEDFGEFSKRQWADFDYSIEGGESLNQVSERYEKIVEDIVHRHSGETVAIGTHGTALCTLIHHYVPSFGYESFDAMRGLTPWYCNMVFKYGRFHSISYHPQI